MTDSLRLHLLRLVGNLAFIAAWAMALLRPAGWQWLGPLLLGAFLVIRVGGTWLLLRRPDTGEHARRAALFSAAIALLAVALWLYTALSAPV